MNDVPNISEREEQILTALAAEWIAAGIDPAERGGFSTKQLAEQFGVSEDDIGEDLENLARAGFIEHVAVGDGPVAGDLLREERTDLGMIGGIPMPYEASVRDRIKFGYHSATKRLRQVLNEVSKSVYQEVPMSRDMADLVADWMIEAHQFLFDATLAPLNADAVGCGLGGEDFAHYDDGSTIVRYVEDTDPTSESGIRSDAFYGDVGVDLMPGLMPHVCPPDRAADRDVFADRDATVGYDVWLATSILRAEGSIDWKRDGAGHIQKRTGIDGRMRAVSAITEAGRLMYEASERQAGLTDSDRRELAVAACVELVRREGAVVIPVLDGECQKLGIETSGTQRWDPVSDGSTTYWGGASDAFLDVLDSVLRREPRIRLVHTSPEPYRKRRSSVTWRGAEMPLVAGGSPELDELRPQWAPVIFVWDAARSKSEGVDASTR